jgi:hypothetical protein
MRMMKKPRYSIKKYILLLVIPSTLALIVIVFFLSLLAIPIQGILLIVVLWFPVCLFTLLYGFYKGLVRHYGFKGEENLFFNGRF